MNSYYICTLGTSVANALEEVLKQKQKVSEPWDASDPQFEKILGEVVAEALNMKEAFFSRSAETTVLHKAGISKEDKVTLLATDTYLGHVCGDATAKLIANGFGLKSDNVEVVRVPGLQLADAKLLREKGLNEFVKAVISRVESCRYTYAVQLCPVGGYKGIVPFLTTLGMVYHLPVLYTFEHIESLVRLPPLPFTIDRDLYSRAKKAFVELGHRCEMSEQEFLSRIEGYKDEERDLFLAFVEPSGRPGFVTTTCFTETFASDFECDTAPVSPDALADLEGLSHGQFYRVACKMVIGAQDKLMRTQWSHPKAYGTDLEILKQGNTNVRVLGYVHADRFCVCRVLLHDRYDQRLDAKTLKKANFPVEAFTEWQMPVDALPESLEDVESPYESALRRLADSENRISEMEREWAAKVVREKAAREKAEQKAASLKKEGAKLADNMASVQGQVKSLNAKIAQYDKRLAEADVREQEAAEVRLEVAELHSRLEENQRSLSEMEASHRQAEQEQFAKYNEALEEIKALKQKLRSARLQLSMAPHDTEVAVKAEKELADQKKLFAEALQNLMTSDKTVLPAEPEPSEEVLSLQLELKKANARIASMAAAERQCEEDYDQLGEAFREAREQLAEAREQLAEATKPRPFWARLVACFGGGR